MPEEIIIIINEDGTGEIDETFEGSERNLILNGCRQTQRLPGNTVKNMMVR
jgi:hypothetical protein